MRGRTPLVPRTREFDVDVERDRDDGRPAILDLGVQRLPPGQAGSATSITGPGEEDHLLAP